MPTKVTTANTAKRSSDTPAKASRPAVQMSPMAVGSVESSDSRQSRNDSRDQNQDDDRPDDQSAYELRREAGRELAIDGRQPGQRQTRRRLRRLPEDVRFGVRRKERRSSPASIRLASCTTKRSRRSARP